MEIKIKELKFNQKDKKTRIYFFVDKENLLSNLIHRRYRPYEKYRKMLSKVFEETGIKPQKASWRQIAGCRCGCSPGFILENDKGKEIFVTI